MQRPWFRWVVGIIAFALPVLAVAIGLRLDHSSLRRNPTYTASVPFMLFGSILLAAIVPAALILSSKQSLLRRLGLTIATLGLLALECAITFYIAMMSQLS